MTVTSALRADLRKLPKPVQLSTQAATAKVLASVLDNEPGARDAAAVAKQLLATMTELHEMAAAVPEEADPVDQLNEGGPARLPDPAVSDGAAGSSQ